MPKFYSSNTLRYGFGKYAMTDALSLTFLPICLLCPQGQLNHLDPHFHGQGQIKFENETQEVSGHRPRGKFG